MNQYIIIFLAIVAASLIVLTLVMPQITYHQSLPDFSLAYQLERSLKENGEFHTNLVLYVYSTPALLKINDIDVEIRITYIVFRVKNSPNVSNLDELYNVWGNQTHAGIVSAIEIKDNGYILTIKYINSTNIKTYKISLADTGKIVKKIAIRNGVIRFRDKAYRINGYRIIEIREIKLNG